MGYPGNGSYPLLKTVKEQFHQLLVAPAPPPPVAAKFQQAYPNPFSRTVTIPFVTYLPGEVKVEVYNVLGQRIAILQRGYLPAGTYSLHWSGFGHPSGTYVCSLTLGIQRIATKIVLLH